MCLADPSLPLLSRVTGRPRGVAAGGGVATERDGYYKESRPLLEALVGRSSGPTARRVALRLGDARLMDGEYDAAVRASIVGDQRHWVSSECCWSICLKRAHLTGQRVIPKVSAMASFDGEVGAEALYLLSQLDSMMGSQVDAVSDLSKLIREHRRIAQRSDVPERMWSIYQERQTRLVENKKWF